MAVDGKGNFYPCLRYSGYSLENCDGCVIGDVDKGIDFDKIRCFPGLSCEMQSNQECLDCEIAEGCAWCQGHSYDTTNGETSYKRATYICNMHKARYRANEYYWGRLREEFNIVRCERNQKSKFLYFIMDDNCVEHCNYNSSIYEGLMPEEVIKKGLDFATPIILNSKNIKNLNKYSYYERYEIYESGTELCKNNQKKFVTVKVLVPFINLKNILKYPGRAIYDMLPFR